MTTVIKSSQEIGSVLKEGCCVATPFFSLFYRRTADETSLQDLNEPGRVAFLAGKKNGNAVWRNAAKRKLRAAWDLKKIPVGEYDILLVAKKQITEKNAHEIAHQIDTVVSREGLLQ